VETRRKISSLWPKAKADLSRLHLKPCLNAHVFDAALAAAARRMKLVFLVQQEARKACTARHKTE